MPPAPAFFEQHEIRRVYDEATEIWWFSVVEILQALIQQPDYQTARKYWNKLKERLTKEGSESVTNCHRLKLPAADGKHYLTDVATAKTGGGFAREAREKMGSFTGQLVVTPENALPSRTRKTLKAPKSVTQTEGDESS